MTACSKSVFVNETWHRPESTLAEAESLFNDGAAALLLPYLLWVGFAAALNWKIVELNAPFAAGG